ncbi:hypothetical protein OG203_01785 [Nocardia sp. NBC_01499]
MNLVYVYAVDAEPVERGVDGGRDVRRRSVGTPNLVRQRIIRT